MKPKNTASKNKSNSKQLKPKYNISRWVKANVIGRMGNQLFITASVYGIASSRKSSWCLDGDMQMLENAMIWIEKPQVCNHVTDWYNLNENGQFATFHEFFLNFTIEDNIIVGDYLQSYKYFINNNLPFKLAKANWAKQWVDRQNIKIGIHVRRTDFLNMQMYVNLMPSISFYDASLRRILEYDKSLNENNFLIFVSSDDVSWLKTQDFFLKTNVIISNFQNDYVSDFTILTQCKHIVTSCGTYAWWAMYMNNNNGLKIYYAKPFLYFGAQDPFKVFEDYYLPSWEGLDDNEIQKILQKNETNKIVQHMNSVLNGCSEICNNDMVGDSDMFFNYIEKKIDCKGLWMNQAIDATMTDDPPSVIPLEMLDGFTYGGKVPIKPWSSLLNQRYLGQSALNSVWTYDQIEDWKNKCKNGVLDGTYGVDETNYLKLGLEQMNLKNAYVLVVGSEIPWVEACVLAAGAASVTTLEYGKIHSEHPNITALTPDEFRKKYDEFHEYFDAVVTFSSVEHSGLGRYGDAMNPWGDRQAVARSWCASKKGARLLIAVMTGDDCIQYNAHRTYGKIMYPHLVANWKQLWRAPGGFQVVHVLEK